MQIKEAITKYNDWAKWVIIVVCVSALAWQFWYQIVSPEYKFYSAKITLTKMELLEKHLTLGEKLSNLDEKHKQWSRKLSG